MIATDAVRALIRKGDDHQLRSQISVGTRNRDDDDGAVAGGTGADRPDHARDGLRALFASGRSAAVPGIASMHTFPDIVNK